MQKGKVKPTGCVLTILKAICKTSSKLAQTASQIPILGTIRIETGMQSEMTGNPIYAKWVETTFIVVPNGVWTDVSQCEQLETHRWVLTVSH